MKILHVFPELNAGGAQRIILQLARDAISRGDSVTVATDDGSWVPELRRLGAAHQRVTLGRRSPVTTVRAGAQLAPVMRRLSPDIVHTHNVRASVAARIALFLSRGRGVLVPTVHGLAPEDYRGAARVLRLVAERVVACAPAVGDSLAAAGLPRERIDVITNGAGLEPADADRIERLAKQLALTPRPLVVGMGRLVQQKDWPTFIEATSRLQDAQVVVAGEGELRPELEKEAERHGGAVRFVGPVSDVAALLGLATCVVSTSTWEGLPLSLLEALSLGVPAVATSVDGVTDLVPTGAAILVEPRDPGAVTTAIRSVLSDAGLRRSLGETARRASRGWSTERMLEEYRSAYEAAVAGRSPWVPAQDPISPTGAASR